MVPTERGRGRSFFSRLAIRAVMMGPQAQPQPQAQVQGQGQGRKMRGRELERELALAEELLFEGQVLQEARMLPPPLALLHAPAQESERLKFAEETFVMASIFCGLLYFPAKHGAEPLTLGRGARRATGLGLGGKAVKRLLDLTSREGILLSLSPLQHPSSFTSSGRTASPGSGSAGSGKGRGGSDGPRCNRVHRRHPK